MKSILCDLILRWGRLTWSRGWSCGERSERVRLVEAVEEGDEEGGSWLLILLWILASDGIFETGLLDEFCVEEVGVDGLMLLGDRCIELMTDG